MDKYKVGDIVEVGGFLCKVTIDNICGNCEVPLSECDKYPCHSGVRSDGLNVTFILIKREEKLKRILNIK